MEQISQESSSTVEELKSQTSGNDAFNNTGAQTVQTVKQEELDESLSELSEYLKVLKQRHKQTFANEFLSSLRDSDFEYGYSSIADSFVKKALTNIGTIAREWINEVFIQNFGDEFLSSAILRVISHFEYYEMFPQGMTMATAGISHISPSVKENAIRAFENWENPECLNILYNIDCKDSWLRDYLQQVVSDLEDIQTNAVSC